LALISDLVTLVFVWFKPKVLPIEDWMNKEFKALAQRVTNLEKTVNRLSQLVNAPRKQYQQTIGPQRHTEEKNDNTGRHPPGSLDTTPSPPDAEETKYRWYNAVRWWNFVRREWKTILERGGIAAGILYAVVTYFQWSDLREHFKIEQRAWVKVVVVKPTPITQDAKFGVELDNIGKSPAIRMATDALFEVVDKGSEASFTYNRQHKASLVGMLFPNDKVTFDLTPTPDNPDGSARRLSAEQVQDLTLGKSYIAIVIQSVYHDQFGMHWTRTCMPFYYESEGPTVNHTFESRSCVGYASVGNGPPKEDKQ
jgi:hypothetical protein